MPPVESFSPSDPPQPLPAPNLFDQIALLNALLSRLVATATSEASAAAAAAAAASLAGAGAGADDELSATALAAAAAATAPHSGAHHHGAPGAAAAHLPPLSGKEFAAEAVAVKNLIGDARRALTGLPDLDRSLAEQRAEIARLERSLRRRRDKLAEMAAAARRAATAPSGVKDGAESAG